MQAAVHVAGYPQYAARVRDCATALFFALRPDRETGELAFKLRSSQFCHWRHCPICQWRRSMRNKAIFLSRIDQLKEAHPSARWLMLTLTVRNCAVGDLRTTIQSMNRAWKALTLREEFGKVMGWVRSVEVTRGKDGSAHPHYHCLLMVQPSYFSGPGYVKTERWAAVWGECLKVDYVPVCDARAVRPKMVKGQDGQIIEAKAPVAAAAAEVLKYATKGQELLDGGPDWLAVYIQQVYGLKFLTSGGILKDIFKRDEAETNNDLVYVDGEKPAEPDEDDDDIRLRFDWYRQEKRYARKRRNPA
ncbi:protein rep [Acidithiobacillus thiooxidans]|uniref:protein rep n=1 Tax=Acidithiobacillus thiooxidans TaxID=930 RepID=UPI001D015A2D|nr:protein rep [Acidithiobacillus thiooxidans]MBU2841078.1 protein rep [Acidithiobacillus thiooxidans]